MANANGVITAPVRLTQDVQSVLGIGGGLGYIITNASIKKWSLNKPVRYPSYAPDRSQDAWRQGADSYDICGLDTNVSGKEVYSTALGLGSGQYDYEYARDGLINKLSNFNNCFLGKIARQVSEWVYVRPTGGDNAPFRLLDFNGYYHNPRCPLPVPRSSAIYVAGSSASQYFVTIPNVALDGSIELSYMRARMLSGEPCLNTFYIAALFVDAGSSGKCFWKTCEGIITDTTSGTGNNNRRILIPYNSSLFGKTWNVYLFLVNTSLNSFDSSASTGWGKGRTSGINVFACCTTPAQVTFTNTSDPVTVSDLAADWTDASEMHRKLRTRITYVNSSATAITPSSIAVTIRNISTRAVYTTFSLSPSAIPASGSVSIVDTDRTVLYPGNGYEMVIVTTYVYGGSTKTLTETITLPNY